MGWQFEKGVLAKHCINGDITGKRLVPLPFAVKHFAPGSFRLDAAARPGQWERVSATPSKGSKPRRQATEQEVHDRTFLTSPHERFARRDMGEVRIGLGVAG